MNLDNAVAVRGLEPRCFMIVSERKRLASGIALAFNCVYVRNRHGLNAILVTLTTHVNDVAFDHGPILCPPQTYGLS
jgi:hypothetical protein